jgi:uncharacterized membrane protein YfcA
MELDLIAALGHPVAVCIALVAIAISFFVSASAGLGGSLVLVPALALVLGTREGVSLAALLLASNNLVKLLAYRHTLPLRAAIVVTSFTVVGAFAGSRLFVAVPEHAITLSIIGSFVLALVIERLGLIRARNGLAPIFGLAAGATSGFTGTSGPLKGAAVRSLGLCRTYTVGAAALVSTVGDVTKCLVYADAGLLGAQAFATALFAVPLMFAATFAGRRFNGHIGEGGYARLFWLVIAGYSVRLILSL